MTSEHPVDIFESLCADLGVDTDPEFVKEFRAVCDEPAIPTATARELIDACVLHLEAKMVSWEEGYRAGCADMARAGNARSENPYSADLQEARAEQRRLSL